MREVYTKSVMVAQQVRSVLLLLMLAGSGCVVVRAHQRGNLAKRAMTNDLDPGETLTIYMGKGTNTRTRQYLGMDHAVLNNTGDEIDIVTYNAIHVTCKSWGAGRCPTY